MDKRIGKSGMQILAASCVVAMTASFQFLKPVSDAYAQSETPQEIVAEQIRRQGYECKKAVGAERDEAASKPDVPVWILRCDSATYRVRLHADLAADVERIK